MRAVSPSAALTALLLAGPVVGLAGPLLAGRGAPQEPVVQEPDSEAEAAPAGTDADSPARQYDHDPAAQKRGSDLFRAVCTGYCHTTEVGAETDAPYLFDCHWDHGGSDADIYRVLVEGVPDTRMQSFGGKLPEPELWRIVSWVRMRSECEESAGEGEGR